MTRGQICVRSTMSGILECTLKAEKGTIYCLWSPEDNILITYAPTIICCFNILSQLSVQSFQGHQNSPSILTINHMGPLVVWIRKDVVVVITFLHIRKLMCLNAMKHHSQFKEQEKTLRNLGSQLSNIFLSPDGKVLILRKSEQLQVYDLQSRSPKPEAVFKRFDKESDVIFAPDGAYFALASAQDGTVSFCHWNTNSLQIQISCSDHICLYLTRW
jgi:WD40 repeat protein